MKQYILSGVALLALMLPSCSEDNLEIPKQGVVTADMFYQDPANAANAVTYVYERGMAAHTVAGNYTRGCIWQGAIFVLTNSPADDIYWASLTEGDHVDCLALNEYRNTFNENLSIIKQAYSAYYQMIHAKAKSVALRTIPGGTEYLFTATDLPRGDNPNMPPAGEMKVYVTAIEGEAPVFTQVVR